MCFYYLVHSGWFIVHSHCSLVLSVGTKYITTFCLDSWFLTLGSWSLVLDLFFMNYEAKTLLLSPHQIT